MNEDKTYGFQDAKILPQAIDVEESVIGAMILETDCFINNPVNPLWFYKEEHQQIIKAIKNLSDNSVPIDLTQVVKKLLDLDILDVIGGVPTITELVKKVSSAAHIEHHIRIIQQEFGRRELIRISEEIKQKSYDHKIDIDDIFAFLQNEYARVMSFGEEHSTRFDVVADNIIKNIVSGIEMGIKTGLAKYDKFTGGLQDTDLVIIAGETSQGKTSLAVTIIKNCVINDIPAAIFSLEMTQEQLGSRMVAQETGISAKKIMFNRMSLDEKKLVLHMLESMKHIPLYFDENVLNDADKICTSIRKMKLKYGIRVALVDFIQDIKGAHDEAGIAEIGRKFKNLAKELKIPIIAISQLNRDKNNPEPNRSRLRGSGQLEEKADIVILLYRPEEYDKSYSEPYEMIPTNGTALVKIAKGRNYGTGGFILNFNEDTTNFYDYKGVNTDEENTKRGDPF